MSLSRRRFLMGSTAAVGVSLSLQGTVSALFSSSASAVAPPKNGYGPLVPDPQGMLDLPEGFSYRVLSREGAELVSGGGVVPSRTDGTGVFGKRRTGKATDRLVRNHECRPDAPHPVPLGDHTYDPGGKGGTTTLVLGRDGKLAEEYVSLSGSAVNCAGGETPWHTWLTCEETEDKAGTFGYTKDHGFIFEVDPFRPGRNADPVPLKAMGRYAHEAIAVDPETGIVYETEDAFEEPFGLFYRFTPNKPLGGHGSLRAGGLLEAMRVRDVPDLSTVKEAGTELPVEWAEVPDPLATTEGIRFQDFEGGPMTHSQKLEGCWWGEGGVYFSASYARTDEGSTATHDGQIWHYDAGRNVLRLEVIFSRDADTPEDQLFQTPDNICVSPYGGLMVCEDGDGDNYVIGVTESGEPYLFARNRQNIGTDEEPAFGEMTGVSFADDAKTMYFNCYEPGTTFAVTGPWRPAR